MSSLPITMTNQASSNDPLLQGGGRSRQRGRPCEEAARLLREHACLSDREVMELREQVDALGLVRIVGVNALVWSVAGYVGAALLLAGALAMRPHWPLLAGVAGLVAVGGLAERTARRGHAAARRARWRLEDALARVSDADMAWVRAYASHAPTLAATLASWRADGRRLRERDLAVIRKFVQAAGLGCH